MALSHKRDAMPLLLILLFPLAEIATFIIVGGAIGVVRTLGLVIVSSLVGVIMLRDAGVMTALKLQREKGNPAAILAEGGARMLAGLLLLIPGFLTDIAAILVLIPATRSLLFGKLAAAAARQRPARSHRRGPTSSKGISGGWTASKAWPVVPPRFPGMIGTAPSPLRDFEMTDQSANGATRPKPRFQARSASTHNSSRICRSKARTFCGS